ncbi:AAA family ATPase [Microbacterium oleivorans]|uniref:AAA family ATPase n=1 Tax=Microbacterium TaxID=33882 RepID=UPI00080DB865|nr:AAA family ATPase [Microbacterium oleivorans]
MSMDANEVAADGDATTLGETLALKNLQFKSLTLRNFLSYRDATIELGDFVALVGPNSSGKSNAVAAIKLLRDIPTHGLPNAVRRRGGYDQLRHRSEGRPYEPSLRLEFQFGSAEVSHYELKLGSVAGKRYEVKRESAHVYFGREEWGFESDGTRVEVHSPEEERPVPVAPGQSALSTGSLTAFLVQRVLQSLQAVEINPSSVADLQEPSSTRQFEPDGSNVTSVFESLTAARRTELVDQLAAIVPGIARIELRNLADRQTLAFYQATESKDRMFLAKQMSDGTLRSFGILLAMLQPASPSLIVIEEPEIAIHVGAMTTLVDILQQQANVSQVLITTHSADIVNALPIEDLRVVWTENGESRLAPVSDHTRDVVRRGLMTPGELLRADSLDPAL